MTLLRHTRTITFGRPTLTDGMETVCPSVWNNKPTTNATHGCGRSPRWVRNGAAMDVPIVQRPSQGRVSRGRGDGGWGDVGEGGQNFFGKIFLEKFFEGTHGEPSPPKRRKKGGGMNKGLRWEGYVGRGVIGVFLGGIWDFFNGCI